jgi:hypothetical protein
MNVIEFQPTVQKRKELCLRSAGMPISKGSSCKTAIVKHERRSLNRRSLTRPFAQLLLLAPLACSLMMSAAVLHLYSTIRHAK